MAGAVDEVVFGRYRLMSLIGEGGMGKVYKAHDTMIDRDVAVKVLPSELSAEPGYRERFRREAHTAARLSEPHIVPIYDTGEIDGQLYLVMPVISGIDLQALLRRDGPMNPHRAVNVIEQLAAALDAAHAVGLVHRDIKPSNALVTARDFVYLIDFGIAHDAAASKLTNTGMIVGTMAYMAPERFTTGTADARTDVYALACVLHECLTGHQPYPGKSMEQQIAGHLTLDPPKPSALQPGLPVALDAVIATGMAKDPEKRYQSAHELAAAARHALTTTPSVIRPPAAEPDATLPAPQPLYFQPPVGPSTPPASGPKSSKAPIWAAVIVAAFALVTVVVVIAIALNTHPKGGTAAPNYPSYSPAPTFSSAPAPTSAFTPTFTTSETPAAQPPSPAPPPDLFIAIASSPPDGWGWAQSSTSMEAAKAAAMAKCSEVNKNCSLRAWNRNGCVALVTGNGFLQGGYGSSKSEAEQDALRKNHGGRVLASVCTS